MDLKLTGKTALVTGSASGIGYAIGIQRGNSRCLWNGTYRELSIPEKIRCMGK